MNTKAFLLAIAIMASSVFAFSQQVVPQPIKTDCDKKVLNKIKRKMRAEKFTRYMADGSSVKFLVTCSVDENQKVKLEDVQGGTKQLKAVVISGFEDAEISCPDEKPGTHFQFWLRFKKVPA